MSPQPAKISRTLNQKWPCRELQSLQLAALLSPQVPSPPTVVVHGISATCKTTLTRAVLSELAVPHAIIRCSECVTGRHLLTTILLEILQALGLGEEWQRYGKGKCEHISALVVLLEEILASGNGVAVDKFVLVLDGIDEQREASHMLLSGLARLGEVIPTLTVVLIVSTTPRPLFLQSSGVAHVSFPPYTRSEAIAILTSSDPPPVEGLSPDLSTKSYPQFVSTVYDSLVGPTAGTIPSFRSLCEKLWPRFIRPVLDETPTGGGWDFARLLVRNRAMFQTQGENMLVHRIVPEEHNGRITSTTSIASKQPPSLPYFPSLILTAAYIASHTPSRLDTIFFSKYSSSSLSARNKRAHHRRRLKRLSQAQHAMTNGAEDTPKKPGAKRVKTRITKNTLTSAFAMTDSSTTATILAARPFTLERLIAIYHAIDPNPPPMTGGVGGPGMSGTGGTIPTADAIYAELATLWRLRLVVPAVASTSMADATGGEKWCINVSGAWVEEIARGIGVEVGEWLAGGLD